jgi:hypothetical protein
MAFLEAQLEELSPSRLRQLKEEIVTQKKKAAVEASVKAQGSDQQPGSAREEIPVSQQKRTDTAGKRKATEVDSSNSGGSMELAARRPALGPLSGTGSAPLPTPAKGKTSKGEQAANSGRQLSYAEVGMAYAGFVAGRPVKGANAGMDSSVLLPTKDEGKEKRDVKTSCRAPPEIKSPRGEKDVTVGTTAGRHLVTHLASPKKPSGPLKPTANGTVILPVPVASIEATPTRTSPGASGEVSGPMSDTPAGTTTPTPNWIKPFRQGSDVTKPRCTYLG